MPRPLQLHLTTVGLHPHLAPPPCGEGLGRGFPSTRSIATWPPLGPVQNPRSLPISPTPHGAPTATPSSASNCLPQSWSPARSPCPMNWSATRAVLSEIETRLKPSILACGTAEIDGLLRGLDGPFVAPGPSGAPTRGRPDVLPTGRNFYSVDSRAVPTPAAYELGKKSAELLVAPLRAGSRRVAGLLRADGLGHVEHAHRRRRYCPGAGADRRQAGLGHDLAPRHRLRDHSAGDASAPARRRDAAHLRLLPRCLSGADRAVRQGDPCRRRAGRRCRRQSDRRAHARRGGAACRSRA